MGDNPSNFKGAKLPVEMVSWDDCQKFIGKLNGLGVAPTGFKFSLPTEAQWEYACRARTTTPFSFGGVLNGDKANCNGNYPYGMATKGKYLEKTTEAGTYPANAWGLYDMHGNVWEWCNDWYGDYPTGSVTDPTGANSGSSRMDRGGGWGSNARAAGRRIGTTAARRFGTSTWACAFPSLAKASKKTSLRSRETSNGLRPTASLNLGQCGSNRMVGRQC